MLISLALLICLIYGAMGIPPRPIVKGHVENILRKNPIWKWSHLKTSFSASQPMAIIVNVQSKYKVTGGKLAKSLGFFKNRDCAGILKNLPHTKGNSGVYTIYPDNKTSTHVYCDMQTDGGGWTVIQRRYDPSVNFYRTWKEYKKGFGRAGGDYWLGNDIIRALTKDRNDQLRVDLKKFSGSTAYAKYSRFYIENEANKYKLHVSGYSGTAGDSLGYHNQKYFSTKDKSSSGSDAAVYHGAWWYHNGYNSNLNGPLLRSAKVTVKSMNWYHFGGKLEALKSSTMMIKPNA